MTATAAASPSSSSRADLSALRQSVGRTHGWEPLRVEGELPPDFRATVLRAGPGLMERFGHRLSHAFEADGAVIGMRVRDGQAHGAVRLVESPGYRREQAAGKPLFGSAAPWWRRFLNGLQMKGKATGNTSVMQWQGRTFALMEGSRPIEIDPSDLSTGDVCDLGGVLGATFSAHPHRLAGRGITYNFGLEYGPKPRLHLYALPDRGPARALGSVPLPFNTMVHDFAVTERHAVFLVSPVRLRISRAFLALRSFEGLFAWEPERGMEVLVVPLDAVDRVVRSTIDARFVFHLANAWERGDELCVDFVQHPDLQVLSALSGREDERRNPPSLRRLVVDPRRGTVHADEPAWDRGCEFPVLPAGQVGQAHSTMWLATSAEGQGQGTGLARLDPTTGRADVWSTEGHSASEALFVPRPGATREDEGWLCSLVLDGWRGESYFAVFDADRPSAGPLAKLWMGQPLPSTYHGTVVH